jgi:caa(3)-type oxidase subunit IV
MNHSSEAAAEHIGVTTKQFIMVWVGLLALTGIEVFLAYMHVPLTIMLVALIGLSVVKAWLIIAWFMHLKFERFSLFVTLFPMLIFCILLLFIFMPDAQRAMDFRPR